MQAEHTAACYGHWVRHKVHRMQVSTSAEKCTCECAGMARELQGGQVRQQAQRGHMRVSQAGGCLAGQHSQGAEARQAAQHTKVACLRMEIGLQRVGAFK
jgi:hypothetical protein